MELNKNISNQKEIQVNENITNTKMNPANDIINNIRLPSEYQDLSYQK